MAHVLVAIIRKQLKPEVSLHTLLQILSLTLFEKLPVQQAMCGIVVFASMRRLFV